MRIGIYVAQAAVVPGYERMVSGHVQIPMRSAQLLKEAGHDVELLTTRIGHGRVLPECVPAGIPLRQITEPSGQGSHLDREVGRRTGFRPLSVWRWIREMTVAAHAGKFDVLHFFGGNRTANLAGLFRLAGGPCAAVATMNVGGFPESYYFATRHLWRRVDRVLTSTEFLAGAMRKHGIDAQVVRHGIVRNIAVEVAAAGARQRHRVLFWREATERNGADLAMAVAEQLAPRYPAIRFTFAVRPHRTEVTGLTELANRHTNIDLFRTPYPAEVSLGSLLAESVCVLQPFRAYTIQPQLSILESLAAGVPVVASDVQSTAELVVSGKNGFSVAAEEAAVLQAVESLISDPARAADMGRAAAEAVRVDWNWQSYVEELLRQYRLTSARAR